MSNSTHRVDVVPLNLKKLEGSDFLSVARVYDYECVTQTAQWEGRQLAAYVPPDTLVNTTRPEFAFLAPQAKSDGWYRIKAKKIRGVRSFGLLVPVPEGVAEGDDVAEQLGVVHYDPDIHASRNGKNGIVPGEATSGPNLFVPKYDVEAGRKYASRAFAVGEPVVVLEKLHGQNCRCVYTNGQQYVGSRSEWKREFPSYDHITVDYLLGQSTEMTRERAETIVAANAKKGKKRSVVWEAFANTPAIRDFCEANPDYILFGEVYGQVQDLKYQGGINFAGFDIMHNGRWLDWDESQRLRRVFDIPWVPILGEAVPFDFDTISAMAEGQSLVPGANNVREGVVVKSRVEREVPRVGRACFKFVGCGYLERS